MLVGLGPLMLLLHTAITDHAKLRGWFMKLLPLSLGIALVFRLLMIFPEWAKSSRRYFELGKYKEWTAQIPEKAGDLPVVFTDGYQMTSQFAFYSGGHPVLSIHPNQVSEFDFFSIEQRIQGNKVLFLSSRN